MARTLTGERLEKELLRLEAMKAYEKENKDCALICGIDEAGRGPLAGPVAAGAVILPRDCTILYLNDSKKLSEKRREELFLEIKEKALAWNVAVVSPARIDEINILQATYEAMRGGHRRPFPDAGPAFKRCGHHSGNGDPADSHCQGRRQKRIHSRGQHPGQGYQGPSDGGV